MYLDYASAVLRNQVKNRHGCSTQGYTEPMTIGPNDMASGWKPVTRKTLGKKKFMKKGFVSHNHDFSDFFQVDGVVIPHHQVFIE